MKCEYCREKLWEFLDGTLPEEEAQELRAHLTECPACAEEAKLVKDLSCTLRDLPEEELPEGFHDELMLKLSRESKLPLEDSNTAVQREGKVVPFPKKKKQNWRNLGLVAAAVVMVAVLGGTQGLLQMRPAQDAVVQDMMEQADEAQSTTAAMDAEEAEMDAVPETADYKAENDAVSSEIAQKSRSGAKTAVPVEGTEEVSGREQAETTESMPEPQTMNAVTAETAETMEQADVQPMTVSQPVMNQPGLRSAAPVWENVTLTVADVPAAMEQITKIGTEMSLTEVEKTETSLTYEMAESQKKEFLERLQEVGSHEADAAETDSQTSTLVKVTCTAEEN